eukprot:Em0016g930a
MESDPVVSDKGSIAILQSSVFIEDALHYRTIHHKIDKRALQVYRAYHSGPVKWLASLCIVTIMVLAFFEYPSSLSISADYRYRNHTRLLSESPPCGATESVEGACLLFFMAESAVQVYLIGWKRLPKKPWLILYIATVLFSLADLTISIAFLCDVNSYGFTLRLRRFFRPLFLLISSNIMKKFAKSIKDTLPQIFAVLFLLFLHLFTFGMIGTVLFSSHSNITNISSLDPDSQTAYDDFVAAENNAYFHTFWSSLINLLVTMTTANHPDIMMPLYQYNRFSAVFFIVFLVIGNFIIFNLLTAVVYNQFKNQWITSMQNSLFRQIVAVRAAFIVLANSSRQSAAMGQPVVGKSLLRHVIRNTNIPSSKLPLLYSQLEPLPSTLLSWKEFRGVFDVVMQGPLMKRKRERPRSQQRVMRWLQNMVQHKLFAYFTTLVAFCNVLLIVVEISIDPSQLENALSRLAYYNLIFACWYVAEHLIRLVGYGLKEYFRSWTNLYSGVLSVAIFVMELLILFLYSTPFGSGLGLVSAHTFSIMVRVLTVLVVLRPLTIVSYVPALSQITTMLLDLLKNLRGFIGILVVVYYLFALLGMELFLNTEAKARSRDGCSPEAFGRAHGPWTQLYFVAWWIVSVVICLHLFVSILLDTFLKKWQDFHPHHTRLTRRHPQQRSLSPPQHAPLEEPSSGWSESLEHVQGFDVHTLHRDQLAEPQDGDIICEIINHGDLYLT